MLNWITDCTGALAPVEATPEMTRPVGQRNGQLFVAPGEATIPDPSLGKDNDVLMVENGKWIISDKIYNRIVEAEDEIAEINEGYDNVISNSEQLLNELSTYRDDLAELIGIDPTDLTTMLTAISDGITAVRTAGNLFGSNISDNDKFAESSSVYATKITNAYNTILTRLHNILVDNTPSNIQNSLYEIESVKSDLRYRINSLYETPPIDNNTPFEDYAGYIVSSTPTDAVILKGTSSNGLISGFYLIDFTVPTQDADGNSYDPTLHFSSTADQYVWPFKHSRIVRIPAYYTGFYSTNLPAPTADTEEVYYYGTGSLLRLVNFINTAAGVNIHTFSAPAVSAGGPGSNPLVITLHGGNETTPMILDLPNVEIWNPNDNYSIANYGLAFITSPTNIVATGIPLQINAPKVIRLGVRTTSATRSFNFTGYTGTFHFDAAAKMAGVGDNDHPITIYLPSITEFDGDWNGTPSSTVDLYLGENLAELGSSSPAYLSNSFVTIHIPTGNTTTKATLDAAGIAYIQDYIP